ncbi:unannotated protein [freshwater metagenome]|jgi:hypothetical protein|uniref:Unannotated protein n=1 Tax=freshwater metagenome TaxID=449393 RepID=A0A6J6WEH5_9ZZZZ|nr:hypothetical protein [Actinomycetota bacterium]MSW57888.1 hypothetical protein [Actinomycetota bacterium]MSX47868.1 hypothetical protein [Actinomycetota bacterium]MSX62237.1 hypothetical protein [Actinomycetota bacterium]MSY10349.1 hypothetical protein [Actinomycetota bacterium]
MKLSRRLFTLVLSLAILGTNQAVADDPTPTPTSTESVTPTLSRADQVTFIQGKYNPMFDAQYARIMAVKKKHPVDSYVLLNIDIILKDYNEVRRVIDASMLSATSDLDAMDSYADEETGEFQVMITNLEQLANSRTTITCVKAKKTKKVSGTKPKCPTGYKKK